MRRPLRGPRPEREDVNGRYAPEYTESATEYTERATEYTEPAIEHPRSGGWREEVKNASALNLLAGIWLIIAPWVLAYPGSDPRWNDVVFGAIVAFIALLRVAGAYRASLLSWLNAAIGVWVFIAAFTIDSSATAGGNDIILGAIVFILGVWSASASETGSPGVRRREGVHRARRGHRGPPLTH
jgi:hypothetical protein